MGICILFFYFHFHFFNLFGDKDKEKRGFYNGYTKVSKILNNTHLTAIINSKGQTKNGFNWQHNYLRSIQKSDLICFEKDNKVGYVNRNGVIVIPAIYDDGRDFSDSGFAVIGKVVNGQIKYGFIRKNGNYLLTPSFDYAGDFREQRAIVGRNSGNTTKYGFIDNTGRLITNTEYDYVSDFIEGFACVGKRKGETTKYGIINHNGVLIYPCIFDNWKIRFDNGIALVERNGKVGLIDMYGNAVYLN